MIENDRDIEDVESTYSEDDFAKDLLNDRDASEPSDNDSEEGEAEETEDTSEDASELSEEENDDSEGSENDEENESSESKAKEADPNSIIKFKKNGVEQTTTVAELIKNIGLAEAVPQKLATIQAVQKQNEEVGERYVAATEALIRNAYERYQPYENTNWDNLKARLAAGEITLQQYEDYSEMVHAAYRDIEFLTNEMDGFMKKRQEDQQIQFARAQREAVAELSDPEKGIPGFNQEMANDIAEFGVSVGIPPEEMRKITSPWAYKLLRRLQTLEAGVKAKTKVVDRSPKNLVTQRTSAETTRSASRSNGTGADKRFRETGSVEDFAKSLLQGWKNGE